MLVLPIVNRNRILKVSIELKTSVKLNDTIDGIEESDILVNKTSFNNSIYNTKNIDPQKIVQFIRNNNIMHKKDFYVSTKKNSNSQDYNVFKIENPPTKVSDGLDRLYGSSILDIKNEIPNNIKGRFIDFKKLGIADNITVERLSKLEDIANNTNSNYRKTLEKNDLTDLIDTLEYLKLFNCTVIKNSSIKIEDFLNTLNILGTTNTPEYKELKKYYETALNNKEVYSLISKLYNIVYNESLNWIKSSDKSSKELKRVWRNING